MRSQAHYYINPKTRRARLYVPKSFDAVRLAAMGPAARVVASSASGAIAILPEQYGEVGELHCVSTAECGAVQISLGRYNETLVGLLGTGNVPVTLEVARYGEYDAIIARPVRRG